MKRLAAGQTPKPRNTGRETRDTGSETQNTLLAAGPMEEGLAKRKKRPNGFFKRMNDDRLIEYTQEIMRENRITTRMGLEKADSGLYDVLRRRDLLAQIGFEEVNRNWARMSDKELVKAAQEFMKEKGITTRNGLAKADRGLHSVLRRRNLLGQVIPESANELHRDWVGMSDERIVEFTQEFMKENRITTREGLRNADSGLYEVLRKRKLLERAFAEVDETKKAEGLDAVCEALEEFGEDG